MKQVLLLLLSISMLGFYSCTKDEDDKTDDVKVDPVVEMTNYMSIDGTNVDLTQNVVVEEGKYYMIDATSGDSTFLRKWKIWIATEDLVIGTDAVTGLFTGLYTEVLSPEAPAPGAGTYVANQAGDGIIPSYTIVYYANGYDMEAQTGTLESITGDNNMDITVSGDNTTIKLNGNSDGKALEISYTAKLNILGAKKKGLQELKF